jgi:hypothetical protein
MFAVVLFFHGRFCNSDPGSGRAVFQEIERVSLLRASVSYSSICNTNAEGPFFQDEEEFRIFGAGVIFGSFGNKRWRAVRIWRETGRVSIPGVRIDDCGKVTCRLA